MKHANIAFFVPMVGCPHRCSFCDQNSITGEAGVPTPAEVDETLKRAARQLRGFGDKTEIAFFGGSFTMIPEELMRSLLEPAAKWVRRGAFSGIRLSTRPDAIDEHIISVLKEYGVTSVELGAQSSDDEVLAKNLRGHSFEDTKRACELIKAAGFSLGLQMMTGMPGSSRDKDIMTAARFAALKPETMRIYPALVLKNTLMAKWYERGEYTPQTVDEAAELCAELLDIFDLYGVKVIRMGLHAEQSLEESLDVELDDDVFEDLGDVPVSIWIDVKSGMIVRVEMDMSDVMQGLVPVLVDKAMEKTDVGIGVNTKVYDATVSITLSEFDAVHVTKPTTLNIG